MFSSRSAPTMATPITSATRAEPILAPIMFLKLLNCAFKTSLSHCEPRYDTSLFWRFLLTAETCSLPCTSPFGFFDAASCVCAGPKLSELLNGVGRRCDISLSVFLFFLVDCLQFRWRVS